MPLIEGIGDEVTALLACLAILVAVAIAWMSTRVSTTVHTSVVIIDRERFAELLTRVRGAAIRSSSYLLQNGLAAPPPQPPARSDTGGDEASRDDLLTANVGGETLVDSASVNVQSNTSGSVPPLPLTGTSGERHDSVPATEEVQPTTVCSELLETYDPVISEDAESELQSPTSSARADIVAEDGADPPEGFVAIRLQFVDGRQRTVFANPDDTIGSFKRSHFATELANNSVVRFIAGGQELRDEASTLRSHRLATTGAVLHCLVTPPRATPATPNSQTSARPFDIGVLMFPLFGSILGALWYVRVMYRGYFNGTSTFSLLAISFLYVVALLASFRGNAATDQTRQQQRMPQPMQPQHAHGD